MPGAPRLISCDEAGFTGPGLLDENQPYFVYAAVDLAPDEAAAVLQSTRGRHRIQAPELKSSSLRKRADWPTIAREVTQAADGRALLISFDKRLNLAGKAFEYLLEPVLQRENSLFYASNLHRFVMNSIHRDLVASGAGVEQLEAELQAFMRGFDPASAPSWFSGPGRPRGTSALDCVQRFAKGYAAEVESGTASLRADRFEGGVGKWTLDLTSTALFSLVWRGWGIRHHGIELLCDDSKPLRAQEEFLNQMGEWPDGFPLTDGRSVFQARANMAKPVAFGSSADHPTLQVADILARITLDVLRRPTDAAFDRLRPWVAEHTHQDHVHPDETCVDMRTIEPRVNLAVLRELARRADAGLDPLEGMTAFFAAAHKKYRNPASRLSRSRRRDSGGSGS